MAAFITAHNMDWVAEFVENVPQIIHKYGGKYLAIAKRGSNSVEVVEGTAPAPHSIVIFTFPFMDAIKSFVDGPEYAPYKMASMAATESNFFAFIGVCGAF